MENKDIIDVEVDEYEIEVYDDDDDEIELCIMDEEVIPEGIPASFMDSDEFDSKINELKEELRNAKYKYSPVIEDITLELIKTPKEDLDNNSYILLMFGMHLTYGKQGNKYGTGYTALRALDIMKQSISKKKSQALDFFKLDIDEQIKEHINTYTYMFKSNTDLVKKKLINFGCILSLVVLAISFFGLFSYPMALGTSLIMWATILLYYIPNLEKKYFYIQAIALQKRLDKDIYNFDNNVLKSRKA